MRRLLSTIGCDLRLQLRNGFYYATLFVVAIYALGSSQLASLRPSLSWLLPAMVLNNLVITTFFFVGGLVLLEKAEGSLRAQIVTPLRAGEYLAAKVITLMALALVHNLVTAWLLVGLTFAVLPLVAGVALASTLFVLFGFVAVARYESINEYMLPSALYGAPLLLPLLYTTGWDSWLLYLHPLQAPVVLMRAASGPAGAWQLVYAVLYSGLWIALAYRLCLRAFRRYVAAG
jgi:fluoroquinolone transport system permease protein